MQGWKAKDVFHAYLDELCETSQGIFLAREARASIAQYLDRETLKTNQHAETVVNNAVNAISKIHTSVVTKALFVCAHAGFEQYIRDLLEIAASTVSSSNLVRNKVASPVKDVLEKLHGHQIQLAGEGFRRYFEPLDHLQIDYAKVARAVAQSSDDDKPFIVEGTVLGFRVGNINRVAIEAIFSRFNCKIPWDSFAATAKLADILKTSRKKDTDKAITEFLSLALERRNRIAHTQGSLEMSEAELDQHIRFLRAISQFLHETLSAHVSTLIPKKHK